MAVIVKDWSGRALVAPHAGGQAGPMFDTALRLRAGAHDDDRVPA